MAYIVFFFLIELKGARADQRKSARYIHPENFILQMLLSTLVKGHFLRLLDGHGVCRTDLRVTEFYFLVVLQHNYNRCFNHTAGATMDLLVNEIINFKGESTYCCGESTTHINLPILIIARMEWVSDLQVAITYTMSPRNWGIEIRSGLPIKLVVSCIP